MKNSFNSLCCISMCVLFKIRVYGNDRVYLSRYLFKKENLLILLIE